MPISSFEIRICDSCGLRYPLPGTETASSKRCPACTGTTRLILSQNLISATSSKTHHKPFPKRNLAVIVDNVRSAWNVGSIFRTANGFGCSHIYVCGITPIPDNDAVKKTSLGAENSVAWSYHKDAVLLAAEIKSNGSKLIALEVHEQATPLTEAVKPDAGKSTVLIVGNEITGVDPHLLEQCDAIHHIPMFGNKKSFNVAVAFGIAAYVLS
ncbi:MAG TPA: RNA methyltransferase [Anaerolineales bacterium]|nr:RNA methyltransferase [Anaerolineales bacterium]